MRGSKMGFPRNVLAASAFLLLSTCLNVEGYGSGAPSSSCETMFPGHGIDTQDTEPVYMLSASKGMEKNRDVVIVTIVSPEGDPYEGFFLQARNAEDKKKILPGSFSVVSNTKGVNCAGQKQDSLTHDSTAKKSNLTTVWTPPPNFEGRAVFRATVARTFDVFWTNLETVPMLVKAGPPVPEDIIPTTRKPTKEVYTAPTLTTPDTTDISTNEIPESLGTYDVCGKTKGCFGMPTMCAERRNCEVLLMYTPLRDGIAFELTAALDNTSDWWIAVGLSEDKKMGGDSVTECLTSDGNSAAIRQSWNAIGSKSNKVLGNPLLGMSMASVDYTSGILTCRWKRQLLTNIEGVTFNIAENNYFLMLAKGLVKRNPVGDKHKHKLYLQSQNQVNLTIVEVVAGKPNYLVKIHGAFMVVAWVGLVSIAVLLARHYKTVWEDRKICKDKVWFFSHRSLMLLAVALIIAAFVVIFLHVDGWSQVAPNPHPIIGCVCTGLGILQPIMAFFRPKPTSSNRYIFNWLHWFVGNAAQILGIVTMYFAVELSAVSLPIGFNWVLSAFVAFHVLFHIIMQIHSFFMDKKGSHDIQMRDLNQKGIAEFTKDSPGSGFRRFMLGIYITVNAGLVTALVLLICLQ